MFWVGYLLRVTLVAHEVRIKVQINTAIILVIFIFLKTLITVLSKNFRAKLKLGRCILEVQ